MGGVGKEQLKWLDKTLQDATKSNQKAVVCCHIPLDPGASSKQALLWNYDEVMDVIHQYGCVKVCLAGNAHKGGHFLDSFVMINLTFRFRRGNFAIWPSIIYHQGPRDLYPHC
ncbi:putative hydrolase [Helianthus annuus]|uniref:Hydrolase n=1 Tax=Helianthus annuus TaxID=4232 RepID=A0A9K3I7R2_HELAN|nr:putative hydrolase [Helianthus annuus]KAJ0527010.1 putative hydrolase [Helianthus annuus]KAJ0543404.1 putative hydrolase [Helianthus annuus]KAJ0708462.1 putative hydrolase [Helianthus annuus]KAJ0712388.1 putative hydrolase [Helianthus annuus]